MQKGIAEPHSREIDLVMVYEDYSSHTITNYRNHVLKGLNELVL